MYCTWHSVRGLGDIILCIAWLHLVTSSLAVQWLWVWVVPHHCWGHREQSLHVQLSTSFPNTAKPKCYWLCANFHVVKWSWHHGCIVTGTVYDYTQKLALSSFFYHLYSSALLATLIPKDQKLSFTFVSSRWPFCSKGGDKLLSPTLLSNQCNRLITLFQYIPAWYTVKL